MTLLKPRLMVVSVFVLGALCLATAWAQTTTVDRTILHYAGMILHRLGGTEQARTYVQRALTTNAHFHISHADLAVRTLAELGSRRGPTISQEQRDGQ